MNFTSFQIAIIILMMAIQLQAQSKLDQAKALYETKKYAELKKILAPIGKKETDFAAARYYLGRVAFDEMKYEEAVDYFEAATEANSKAADYFIWLGDTYGTIAQNANVFRQGMLAPKMRKAWEAAIGLDLKNIRARTSLIQFYLQAPGFMGGSFEKAKEMANQIMKIKPAEGHLQLGTILLQEKKKLEAEKEFIEMAKVDPAYAQNLAGYYSGQKQYDKAFSLYEEVLQKKPGDYMIIYQIGKASALSGQKLDYGEECLKKYLANYTPKPNEPSFAGAKMRLGQIKEKKGQKTEAKKLFESALKEDGNLKEAKEGLERVSK